MLRSLFSALAIFVLVFSLCLFPQTASARRCPEEEPETLLSLYQNSDAIYAATFDRTVDGEVVEDTDDYTAVAINKHFTISNTLKGPSRKFFVLEDRDYRYKNIPVTVETVDENTEVEAVDENAGETEPEEAEEEPEEEYEDETELKNGDTLLLFVKNGEGDEAPTLADYRDGIKKLSTEKIGVYEARIRDLNSIFDAKKVNEMHLLEWLMRCAEDPITRWEGTYELLQSVRNREYREKAAEQRKERIARGEPVEEEAAETEETDDEKAETHARKNFDTNIFANLLDDNHKQTLANLLLDGHGSTADARGNDKPDEIAGDQELVELVAYWGDPRLVGFLLDKLRAGSEDPYFASQTMETIAEIIDDKEVSAIAEKYSENAYEDDNDLVESDDEESDDADAEVVEEPVVETADEDPLAKPAASETGEDEAEPPVSEKPEARKQTYRDLRFELIQKFLVQCDRVLAECETEKETNSAR